MRKYRNVSKVCIAMGIHRSTCYVWRDEDAAFGAAWDEIMAARVDDLEDVAFKVAAEGNVRMIMFLLSGWRPEKYHERREVAQRTIESVRVEYDTPPPYAPIPPRPEAPQLAPAPIEGEATELD